MNFSNKDYSEKAANLTRFGVSLTGLIEELLIQDDKVQFHSVTNRVKNAKSVIRKLSNNPDKYSSFGDLTDLLGIRIITYFPHDVDAVAEVLRGEFKIDEKNSVDKRKLLEPDKFGYLSLHFVAELKSSRAKLAEYKRFEGIKFEIQIRSILQHAWAEIEHDLGYKSEGEVPDEVKRNFSRLAGLLELADEEFERIRLDLSRYEEHVEETILSSPEKLMIDQSTVVAAIDKEPSIQELDEVIGNVSGRGLAEGIDTSTSAIDARELRNLGVEDIEQLVRYAKFYKPYVESFAKKWLGNNKLGTQPFRRGIGLFYLCYVLLAQSDESTSLKWNKKLQDTIPDILAQVMRTWTSVVNDLGEPQKPPYRSKPS
jgi:putative GTP pyrophosphokinase